MDIEKLVAFITNKIGVQCNYNKKDRSLSFQIRQCDRINLNMEMIGKIDKYSISAVIQHMKHSSERKILIFHHINKILAEQLQKENIQYIDFSGNVFINAPPIFVLIRGESPIKSTRPDPGHFSLSVASIKIIFTLLVVKNALNKNYRDIAKMSDVALGSVSKTLLMLQKNGYIIENQNGEKYLRNKENLLSKWCISYAERLRPKLILDRFSTDNLKLLQEMDAEKFHFQWGGEIAAAKLINYLKPKIFTLYADTVLPIVQLKCRLKRNADGNIELLNKFWNFDTKHFKLHVVPLILIYADLLSSLDDRNQETAEIIYDKYIKKQME